VEAMVAIRWYSRTRRLLAGWLAGRPPDGTVADPMLHQCQCGLTWDPDNFFHLNHNIPPM